MDLCPPLQNASAGRAAGGERLSVGLSGRGHGAGAVAGDGQAAQAGGSGWPGAAVGALGDRRGST